MNRGSLSIGHLESHLWTTANIIRGPVDVAEFKTFVFPFLFFKRISEVHDEEYRVALKETDGDEAMERLKESAFSAFAAEEKVIAVFKGEGHFS
jgi:type I restriction enzyme M protein